MQAITTKYFGPTNHRGARIKATSGSGKSVTIGYPHELNTADAHRLAAETLCIKLAPWFDAAVVAPLLFPAAAPRCCHLDDWLAHFGIAVYARHGALADAYATAELWLVLLQAAQRDNIASAQQLQKLLRARRWLSAN